MAKFLLVAGLLVSAIRVTAQLTQWDSDSQSLGLMKRPEKSWNGAGAQACRREQNWKLSRAKDVEVTNKKVSVSCEMFH
jgi:hypothetical protein